MKFLFDENVPNVVTTSLSSIYPARTHQFLHVSEVGLDGALDPELYSALPDLGFDAIVTEDRRQLRDHLEEIVASGVHWIGYKSKQSLRGQEAFTYKTATIVAGMDHVVGVLRNSDEQQLIQMYGVGLGRQERIKVRTHEYLPLAQAS